MIRIYFYLEILLRTNQLRFGKALFTFVCLLTEDFFQGNYGDVTSRKLLRQKLQCKSFEWYLTEIFPELFIPSNAVASGEVSRQHRMNAFISLMIR